MDDVPFSRFALAPADLFRKSPHGPLKTPLDHVTVYIESLLLLIRCSCRELE